MSQEPIQIEFGPIEKRTPLPNQPQQNHEQPPSNTGGFLASQLAWLLSGLAILLLCAWLLPWVVEEIQYSLVRGKIRAEYESAGEVLDKHPLADLSMMYEQVSRRVGPSVVHINTRSRAPGNSDELHQFFGPDSRESQGQGSGVIVSEEGFIVTNYHVIRGAAEIDVAISGRRPMSAKVVGVDVPTDVAVLRVNAEDLIPAVWGDSDETNVGSLVWAVGSPFGLERTITSGILSAKNRAGKAGTVYQDFLQTDAAVNPGNSGGPLVDADGRIVGINTAIIGQTYQGISFAIPSNVARTVYERIRNDGYVSRGWLGVQLEEVTPDRAAQLGIAVGKGAYVVAVVNDPDGPSPAKRAGIVGGDVVLKWDGEEVDGPMSLSRGVANTSVGATVTALVQRGQQLLEIPVTVSERATRF
ncbi:MAG: trypsin-like peptidase domain-containing protein [bacterium]|nr:trypsin-like peptidase domain-containing protein [bacterium]